MLETIRQHDTIARIDIARDTGFSPATVTAITAELMTLGMIEPTESGTLTSDQKRGRPRSALKLRADAFIVAGVKVGSQIITVVLSDFVGNAIGHYDHPLSASPQSADLLCQDVSEALSQATSQFDLTLEDIAGAALGLAGYVDGKVGFVHWSSSLTERSVDMQSELARVVSCPVFIENDVNLVAKAEQLFGLGKTHQSFLVVTIEHGIGLGIVINGALHRGARGCGAELGHVKMVPNGALCQCGQKGCLEAYAGEYALVARANHGSTYDIPDFEEFQDAIAQNEPSAINALVQAQEYFAIGLANLVNLFDPERIIVASKVGASHPLCQPKVLEQINEMVVQVDKPMPEIVIHGWGDLMWAHGAAAHALEEVAALKLRERE